jgi:hypothetical protein
VNYARLFDIETCQEIKEFSQLDLLSIGELIEPTGRVYEIVGFRQLLLVNPPLQELYLFNRT